MINTMTKTINGKIVCNYHLYISCIQIQKLRQLLYICFHYYANTSIIANVPLMQIHINKYTKLHIYKMVYYLIIPYHCTTNYVDKLHKLNICIKL